jgi:D-3-phosphoglycerate dehydrogenase
MKILVADKFEQIGLDGLKEAGFEVVYNPDLKEESLREAIQQEEPQGLIVRSTLVPAEMMHDSLKLIVRAGAGYNTIDIQAAAAKGIQVANCPGKNAAAVAELTFGLILSLDRRIPDNVFSLRQGRWNKKEFSKAKGIHGRTIGVIGLGNIGQLVVQIAKAFGMEVIAYSRHLTPEDAESMGIRKAATLEELAQVADVVAVTTALTEDTRGMLDRNFFQHMKPGAYFVNTSRAEIVDQSALLEAVDERGIRAALDVFEGEPSSAEGEYDGPLKDRSDVYCTHHIGASTEQAQEAVAIETVRIFVEFAKTGCAPNCVNC